MAETYPKINTLYMRDEYSVIIPEVYTRSEFAYLAHVAWECTEKIDGTNIRVVVDFGEDGTSVAYQGRTDKANIPAELLEKLHSLFDDADWKKIFPDQEPGSQIILFGEGYGRKIQGCGSRYISKGVDFILFDIKVGHWWLKRADCLEIADKLGIKVVPLAGYWTIPEAEAYVKAGFKSEISEDRELDAEGLVLKIPDGLLFRSGERIITKIKTCDFRKYEAKYGDTKPIQKLNPFYSK